MDKETQYAAALKGIDVDPVSVRRKIRERLEDRLAASDLKIRDAKNKPTLAALREQGAFVAGAITALHAVFGEGKDELTSIAPVSWILLCFRGELIIDQPEEK